jgi:uncharacterized oxidoreductase
MKLSDNKILITGGNKGIGLALAQKFLSLRNEVIITGRNVSDLEAVKQKFPGVFTFRCDLTKDADLDRLIVYIENEHPDLNILINNAGIQYNYDIASEHDINFKAEHEIKTNFSGPIKLTLSLLPLLRNNKDAAIVNITSALGIVPKRSAPVYCATKAATHIFTKALRYQLTDVKVFEVIPPLVATQMTERRGLGKISPEQVVEEFIVGFKRNHFEISVGKVKILRLLHRIWPAVAERMLKDR